MYALEKNLPTTLTYARATVCVDVRRQGVGVRSLLLHPGDQDSGQESSPRCSGRGQNLQEVEQHVGGARPARSGDL